MIHAVYALWPPLVVNATLVAGFVLAVSQLRTAADWRVTGRLSGFLAVGRIR